jgi:glycosyltransferase involved in cell wall biosynthesis
MPYRIAVVQHGDYGEAQRLVRSGRPEPYFGMRASLAALERLFGNDPYLVVSVGAAAGEKRDGNGTWIGLPRPAVPGFLPETLAMMLWARRISQCLSVFRPTHLLLRVSGLIGWRMLKYAARQSLDTLVIFASTLSETRRYDQYVTRKLIRLLNGNNVYLVGNHRAPATASLVAAGLRADKAVAYDVGSVRRPENFPVKDLLVAHPSRPVSGRIVFAGSMVEAKGIGDLIDAVGILRGEGSDVELIAVGDGPELPGFTARAADLPPGAVSFRGRISNEETFNLMRDSALVVVPTRHDFPEGMPLTLTEALASRTPVIVSDHPVMAASFCEGQGLRFFKAADPPDLARVIRGVLDSPADYRALSESTPAAFARVDCKTLFSDLLERWRGRSGGPA